MLLASAAAVTAATAGRARAGGSGDGAGSAVVEVEDVDDDDAAAAGGGGAGGSASCASAYTASAAGPSGHALALSTAPQSLASKTDSAETAQDGDHDSSCEEEGGGGGSKAAKRRRVGRGTPRSAASRPPQPKGVVAKPLLETTVQVLVHQVGSMAAGTYHQDRASGAVVAGSLVVSRGSKNIDSGLVNAEVNRAMAAAKLSRASDELFLTTGVGGAKLKRVNHTISERIPLKQDVLKMAVLFGDGGSAAGRRLRRLARPAYRRREDGISRECTSGGQASLAAADAAVGWRARPVQQLILSVIIIGVVVVGGKCACAPCVRSGAGREWIPHSEWRPRAPAAGEPYVCCCSGRAHSFCCCCCCCAACRRGRGECKPCCVRGRSTCDSSGDAGVAGGLVGGESAGRGSGNGSINSSKRWGCGHGDGWHKHGDDSHEQGGLSGGGG